MNRRDFFLKTLQATAAGILVPEHLLKGRSMVSLCGIDTYQGPLFLPIPLYGFGAPGPVTATETQILLNRAIERLRQYDPTLYPLTTIIRNLEKA